MNRAEKEVVVVNPLGLHLRAAGALVQIASGFDADIKLVRGTLEASAKSIISVLSLSASEGTKLLLVAEGTDSENAVKAISDFFVQGLE